jgi:hypothetical protein
MGRKEGENEWIYKATAKRRFGLTDNQIRLAIEAGLVEAKQMRNPHYSSGPPATVLKVEDIVKNLDKIAAFPRLSDRERTARRVYADRTRARKRLAFRCPRCGEYVRPLRGSTMFEAYYVKAASEDEARRALLIAHYRHAHTEYERAVGELREKRYRRYEELRGEGYDFELAWQIVDDELGNLEQEVAELRKRYTKEAVDLLRADGLLPEEERTPNDQEGRPC